MRLILSSHDPENSVYSTDGDGQVLYQVVNEWGSSVATLRKAVNNGQLALYAKAESHRPRSTRLRFHNADIPVDEYFRREGLFNPKRVFRAALDGREYYWKSGRTHLKMFRNDGTLKEVVKFREHRFSLGPFITGRPASLEVDDSCVPILDEIIMTFIYCRQQGRSTQPGSGSGGDSSGAVDNSFGGGGAGF